MADGNNLTMNKLQLYITKSGNDFKTLFNLNPNEDVRRYVRDLTDAVQLINYDPDEKNIFYMLSSLDEGYFFTILRTIPPYRGHHLATWIFIPAGTVITPQQLEHVITLTTRKISNSEVSNEDVAAMREAFNVDYQYDKSAPLPVASGSDGYAWRSYGGGSGLTLGDYTAEGLYQQSYLPFNGVLLVDADMGYSVNAVNLNDSKLGAEAAILPPESSDEGFKAYVFGRKLDHALRGTVGADLRVMWRRPGFEDVVVDEVIDTPRFTPQMVSTVDSRKLITPASFQVTSQATREALSGCQIRVNGHDITPEGHAFTSDELRHAQVTITCDGYIPYTAVVDLAATTRALVQMMERRKVYRFEVPVKSSDLGAPIKFEINSQKYLTGSPLEGYELLDDIQEGATRTNHLGYVGGHGSWLEKSLYALGGLVAGLLIGWLFSSTCSGSGSTSAATASDSTAVQQTAAQDAATAASEPAQTTNQAPAVAPADAKEVAVKYQGLDEAVKYLDNNKVWKRDQMEEYAQLRGLYDDMNNYKLERIAKIWAPKLKASKTFAGVASSAQLNPTRKGAKGDKGRENVKNAPYSKDGSITVQSWRYRVEP